MLPEAGNYIAEYAALLFMFAEQSAAFIFEVRSFCKGSQ
jgi:hypothetical protein